MKSYFSLSIILCTIVLAGCVKSPTDPTRTSIGCAVGEVEIDGSCTKVEGSGTNITLFDQNLDGYVTGKTIEQGTLRGYYVEPTGTGTYPGIVMIHEWWGLNDNIKYMAKLLAKEGYKVFAIDLYGEVAQDADRARTLSTGVRENPEAAIANMKQAVAYLQDTGKVSKLGSLGWCFGGQQSLNLSLENPMDATVVYYGNLSEDLTKLTNLKGPVLGVFGDKDTSIPLEKITLFQKNLNDLDKENSIAIYPGLGHAFANPSGANYASGETIDAWNKTLDFLAENLK